MYTEFFKLCGYEQDEIERERPRIDKAFKRLGLDTEDIRRGEKRVRELFDIELEGVRKLLGIWMKELIDLVLAKDEGKKVVYGSYPPIKQAYMVPMYACEDLYVTTPELVIDITMGSIFDKLNPILEAAEENGLAPGLAHCSLLQARLGALVKGMIPVPDLLLNSAHFCDQTPKVDELIHELYGATVAYMDSCWDQNWGDYPNLKERRIEYMGGRIDMAWQTVEEVLGCQITEESQHSAARENAKLWANYTTLTDFVAGCDPQPLSQVDQALIFYFIVGVPTRHGEELNGAISTLIREAKQRFDRGKGVVEKGAPRVVWCVPSTVDPEILRMVEGLGLAVPLTIYAWLSPLARSKTKHRAFAERIAESLLRDNMVFGTEGFIEYIKQMCRTWKLEGLIHYYPFSCRPISFPALMIKKAVQDELNIPVLALEADWYDKRDYGVEQLRTRVETFAELLKANKAM